MSALNDLMLAITFDADDLGLIHSGIQYEAARRNIELP